MLEPAEPTDECPHQFGYYRLGDSKNCGQFMNCANGRGFVFDCPEGLAFNQATYQCDWPDLVAECDAEGKINLVKFIEKEISHIKHWNYLNTLEKYISFSHSNFFINSSRLKFSLSCDVIRRPYEKTQRATLSCNSGN